MMRAGPVERKRAVWLEAGSVEVIPTLAGFSGSPHPHPLRPQVGRANQQSRIFAEQRPPADHHRVDSRPQRIDPPPVALGRDRRPSALDGVDLAVERRRDVDQHVRPLHLLRRLRRPGRNR